jgi:hypothetical protein
VYAAVISDGYVCNISPQPLSRIEHPQEGLTMQKVDIAIVVIGALALLTTGLGIAFYDDVAGQDDYTVMQMTESYAGQDEAVGSTPTVFTFDAPNNTYGSEFDVTVTFTNQNPGVTGPVTVTGSLEGLDGSTTPCDGNAPLADGSVTFTCKSEGWIDMPESGKYTDEEAEATAPGGQVKLTITVTGPGTPLALGPQPTYDAAIEGNALVYHLVRETSDPEAI